MTPENTGVGRHDVRTARHESRLPRHSLCPAGHHRSPDQPDSRSGDAVEHLSEADPLVAALRGLRGFLRAGWSFNTRLAERMPQAYLSGWSL